MKEIIKNIEKNKALVVGTWKSKIWQSVANLLTENFDVIKTSKSSLGIEMLDILDVQSIKKFIRNYREKYGKETLKTVFLNSGIMNSWDTINRSNFFLRANNWDPTINTHLNNIMLVERLQMAWIIDTDTKVIYNASVQIVDKKKGYEDYAYMKRLVSSLLLNDDRWNPTILCASLVKWTAMENNFKKKMNKNWNNWFGKFIEENMPHGQPSLADIDNAVEQILIHKEETRGKLVFVDWWSINNNKDKSMLNNDFFYDKKKNSLLSVS